MDFGQVILSIKKSPQVNLASPSSHQITPVYDSTQICQKYFFLVLNCDWPDLISCQALFNICQTRICQTIYHDILGVLH